MLVHAHVKRGCVSVDCATHTVSVSSLIGDVSALPQVEPQALATG